MVHTYIVHTNTYKILYILHILPNISCITRLISIICCWSISLLIVWYFQRRHQSASTGAPSSGTAQLGL